MTKYLILYRAPESASGQMADADAVEAASGLSAWNAWRERAGAAVVDFGSPVEAITPIDEPIGGYSILEADSPAELQRVLEGHPHTAWGGTIDILEFIDLPGM